MNKIIQLGQLLAIVSFVIDTCLFSFLIYFGKSIQLLQVGVGFIGIAFVLNALLFIVLICIALVNKHYRIQLLKTCGLLILNVPVVVFYMYVIFEYFNL